ncbi:MAG: hypothetical protein K9N49_00985, partial [Candidatus Marinimicrobia bacterium]|nr:hypothetical protein [Candidatus Neomarinimicrobiota bacterium]
PSLGVASQPADLFGDERIPAVHVTRVTPRASGLDPWITVAVINWEDHERVLTVPIPPEAGERLLVWEFFEQRFVGLFQRGDSLPVAVPAHGTRLLRIAAWAGRSLALLGTDRHFSMGGVELADWRAGDNTVAARVCSPWPGEFTLWFAAPGRDSGAPQIIARRVRDGDLLNERNDR